MIRTYGLTHLAIGVRDVERAFRFYADVLGMVAVYRGDGFLQAQTPGTHDALVFERDEARAARASDWGIAHFGFRLAREEDIDDAVRAIERAGGTVTSRGEFVPGEPYVFFRDLDGYEVEIWYELPTPVDPPSDAPYERTASEVTISTDPARLDLDVVHGFLRESYWSPGIPRATLERAIANSIPFGAYLGGAQVGFARIVTDRATFAYLADVFVLDAHRGRGVGRALIGAVLGHPDVQHLRRFMLATRDAAPLYAPFGFTPLARPDRFMELTRRAEDLYAPAT